VETTHQLCEDSFGVAIGISLEKVLGGRLQLQQMVKINCIAGSQVAHRSLQLYERVLQPNCRTKHLRQYFSDSGLEVSAAYRTSKRHIDEVWGYWLRHHVLTVFEPELMVQRPIQQELR